MLPLRGKPGASPRHASPRRAPSANLRHRDSNRIEREIGRLAHWLSRSKVPRTLARGRRRPFLMPSARAQNLPLPASVVLGAQSGRRISRCSGLYPILRTCSSMAQQFDYLATVSASGLHINESVRLLFNQSVSQAINKVASQSVRQSVSQSISQSVSQSGIQSVSQSVNHPASQSASQQASK